MEVKSKLYFIAIIPPEPICSEITELKELVAEKFGSHHALRSPPHITLHMPFKWRNAKKDRLYSLMENLNNDLGSFSISLKGYDFFEPRVVFVKVEESEELSSLQVQVVNSCRTKLNLDNSNYKNLPFHPHLTIGFRDLKKPDFYRAKEYFSNQAYSAVFQVDRVSLLEHDGKNWQAVNFRS